MKTIDHLVSKKGFENFVAYGKIKVDGNFLNKVINDKKRTLNFVPPNVDKAVYSSRYRQDGYVPNSGFNDFDTDGSYGTVFLMTNMELNL